MVDCPDCKKVDEITKNMCLTPPTVCDQCLKDRRKRMESFEAGRQLGKIVVDAINEVRGELK